MTIITRVLDELLTCIAIASTIFTIHKYCRIDGGEWYQLQWKRCLLFCGIAIISFVFFNVPLTNIIVIFGEYTAISGHIIQAGPGIPKIKKKKAIVFFLTALLVFFISDTSWLLWIIKVFSVLGNSVVSIQIPVLPGVPLLDTTTIIGSLCTLYVICVMINAEVNHGDSPGSCFEWTVFLIVFVPWIVFALYLIIRFWLIFLILLGMGMVIWIWVWSDNISRGG